MNDNQHKISAMIDIYDKIYEHTQGGIFRNATREKLLGKRKFSGRGQPANTFWYRQRENVKTALIDLQLFIEVADEKNVDQVITIETLEPILYALLYSVRARDLLNPIQNRAEIANLFIQWGFIHLKEVTRNITLSHQRTIDEALDVSNFLTDSLKPEKNRRYSAPGRVHSP